MFESVCHEPYVGLPRFRLRDEQASLAHGELERVPLQAALADREGEVEDALTLRVPDDREEEHDRLRPGLREGGAVLHRHLRPEAPRVPTPPPGAEPLP